MKCPYCNQEHSESARFCENTGNLLLKACENKDCSDFGKHILPLEAKFCPKCGSPIRVEGKDTTHKKRDGHSQIVVVCSKDGSFIQIGKRMDKSNRQKRIELKMGENLISVEEYPELQYGFSFNIDTDNPKQVEKLILDNYDTSKITDMSDMFSCCSGLKSLDLSGFDTSRVTDMSGMFLCCRGLKSLDLSSFNTSNITDMRGMFYGCTGLNYLHLTSFNTSNVTDMSSMFKDCSSLESLDLSGFNLSNVTDIDSMFEGCSRIIQYETRQVMATASGFPFHIRHPEYDLVPYCDFKFKNELIIFSFKIPEYIEDARILDEGYNYLYIARKEKLGVMRYNYIKHWWCEDYHGGRIIIPCEYDKIEDKGDYYKCFKDGKIVMFDRKGKKIK